MMRRAAKHVLCLLLCPLPILFTTGCWNNRDLTDLAIMTGMGVDLTDSGNVMVTGEFYMPSSTKASGQESTGQSSSQTVDVSAEGSTVFSALRSMIPKLSKKAYLSHLQIVVIGETMGKKGLDSVWDFFEREHEVGRRITVLVAKGTTAQEVLHSKPVLEKIGSVAIKDTSTNTAYSKNVQIKSFMISDLLAQPLTGIVMGAGEMIESKDDKSISITGGAVFRHGKLVGYFDQEQTLGYNFATNQVQSTILNIENPKEAGRIVSLEVLRASSKIKASMSGGKPVVTLSVEAQGNIGEEQGEEDLSDSEGVNKIETEAEEYIYHKINLAVKASQNQLDSDVFGVGEKLSKNSYKQFEKIAEDWDEVYPNVQFNIKVRFDLRRPGIILKPAYRQR